MLLEELSTIEQYQQDMTS